MKNTIIFILSSIILLLLYYRFQSNKILNYDKVKYNNLLNDNSKLLHDSVIEIQDAIIIDQDNQIELLSQKVFKKDGKKTKKFIANRTNIGVTGKMIPYRDTILVYDTSYLNTMGIPKFISRKFYLEENYFNIGGKVLEDGVLIDSLRLNDSFYLRMYPKGFFNNKLEIQTGNTNPYVKHRTSTFYYKAKSKTPYIVAATLALWEGIKYILIK